MPVAIHHDTVRRFLHVILSGKLNREDYQSLAPDFEALVAAHGKLRVMFELRDFHGWTAAGLWEDLKFDVKHYGDLERLAVVGEKRWHSLMTTFIKPFTAARVRYFESFEFDDAVRWLTQERQASTPISAGEVDELARRAG